MSNIGYYPDNYSIDNDTIHIQSQVTIIENSAFREYNNLLTVIFDSAVNLITIDDYAFSFCENITQFIVADNLDIYLPDSVTYIGNFAFLDCISNATIYIPRNLIYLGDNAFQDNGSNISIVILPSSLTYLGSSAFEACDLNETRIVMNCNKINKIPNYCFKLNSFNNLSFLPNFITILGKQAFQGGMIINDLPLVIPNHIEFIDDFAFSDIFPSNIQIPDSVIYIGDSVFDNSFGGSYNDIIPYSNFYDTLIIPSSVQHLGILFADVRKKTINKTNNKSFVPLTDIINYSTHFTIDPSLYPGINVRNGPQIIVNNTISYIQFSSPVSIQFQNTIPTTRPFMMNGLFSNNTNVLYKKIAYLLVAVVLEILV